MTQTPAPDNLTDRSLSEWPRSSGVLLHPTSLPGPYGTGELGQEARQWVDWLQQAGQTYWQILPLGPTGHGNSPYQTLGAFAGNPLMVSLGELLEWGLLTAEDLQGAPHHPERVDFDAQTVWRSELLWTAYRRFQAGEGQVDAGEFVAYKAAQAGWLDNYALFRALKEVHGGAAWFQWPAEYRRRDQAALTRFQQENFGVVEHIRFIQFLFEKQWQALRAYAGERGVQIVGDLPIFVALDSSDVWAHQDLFALDEQGSPEVQAGVPPDYFAEEGQLWGNPLYRWDRMQAQGFDWWVARFARSRELYDLIRVDHFRGFEAYWEVPYPAENAMGGHWVPAPGRELLAEVRRRLGDLPIIAEDLGVITPEVEELRDEFELPGMVVLQFAFSDEDFWNSPFYPANIVRNRVVYTGTHDNDTTLGWWRTATELERHHFRSFTSSDPTEDEVTWRMLGIAWHSRAHVAIAPLQDLLNLGTDARMNVPGSATGHWGWRTEAAALTPELAARLRELTEESGRLAGRAQAAD
ncbi:4-alpha-glucanotransferase [Deinococcus proteolyticus MRP]|uniref:4-alpha-glucanotransferase n=1 Tax=Deinococcus proteolyticus (strain ATCC 35074 / DSM 20540 / JCM 6276 / NBRC 101906 / NCIMB 13154 / VKM Ac-1939 / CCM 2703 / MRP) TaxID=693977 RepID=F0RM66_DEIPM|nr:4-alpha-glucanotransferase [Deinococcus proteolyticus]ADY25986.1 4-alpha-glucanotransferase [Deinococcus proteolyticus MRP]